MDGFFIVTIVVILCSIGLYLSLKKRIDEIGGSVPRELPPVNIYCTPQYASGNPGMQEMGTPQVSVTPTPSSNEEMAAVIMAAVAAYESESDEIPGAMPFVSDTVRTAPAHVHEVEKYKHQRRSQRWAATARYENHKRL